MSTHKYSFKKVLNKNFVAYFTKEDAENIALKLGIFFKKELFSLDDFTKALNVELEHGYRFPETNITDDDPILTGKIALAHLNEYPDYYDRLEELEEEAEKYWNAKYRNY